MGGFGCAGVCVVDVKGATSDKRIRCLYNSGFSAAIFRFDLIPARP
jgi:hypothetical protein